MNKIFSLLCILLFLASCNTQKLSYNATSDIIVDTQSIETRCDIATDELLKELSNINNEYGISWKYNWEIDDIFYSQKTNSCIFIYSFMFEKCSEAEIGFCDQTFKYVLDYASKEILVNGLEAEVSEFEICESEKYSYECNYQESIKALADIYR